MSTTPTATVAPDSPESLTSPKIEAPAPAAPPVTNTHNAEAEQVVGREPIHMPPGKEEALQDTAVGAEAAAAAATLGAEASAPVVEMPKPHPLPPTHEALAHALMAVANHLHANAGPLVTPPKPALVVEPEVFKKAEQNIATFIGSKIASKDLTKGLVLTLGNEIDHNDPNLTDVTLAFSGPMVAPNISEMHKELMDVLRGHPEIGPIFGREHTANTYYDHTGDATLHLNIPAMSTEQYVKLMNALAAPAVAAMIPVAHDEMPEKTDALTAQVAQAAATTVSNVMPDGRVSGLHMQLAPTV